MALNPLRAANRKIEEKIYGVLQKFGYPPLGYGRGRTLDQVEPPYGRQVDPRWLENIAHQHSLINNSIEEKVQQTFRRGFTTWTKKWEAKCPECKEEFQTLDPFYEQLGLDPVESDIEIDLEKPRPCPNCEEMVLFDVPDADDKERAESFFQRANMRDKAEELAPFEHSSISQTFLELCKEVAWDIQIFDDGWMIFQRTYVLDEDGNVIDWELQDVHRTPPYLMRYSVNKDSHKPGDEYWLCIKCRAQSPDGYYPQEKPGPCEDCGNRTYEVYAYALNDFRGEPEYFYIRGEFAHGSEYRPRFLYGYSPILSLYDEARTLEQMDMWYRTAYEYRRAPRGAIIIRSSNNESTKAWNKEQMIKLNNDVHHVPTFIDDSDNGGDPLKWISMLEEPAAMQHMQMREWYLERITAKYGVTAVFQTGAAEGTGMSQSLEIIVSNRSAERLKQVFEDVFIPAFIGQTKAVGWERHIEEVEEEDEDAKAQRVGRHLQNSQLALSLGAEVEWTKDNEAIIKPGRLEEEEDDMFGGAFGGGPQEASVEPAGTTTPQGGRPHEPDHRGGAPDTPENPTTDEPYRRSADEKNNAVTSGDAGGPVAGYRNTVYGEPQEEEVIDYLTHIREVLSGDTTPEKRQKALEEARAAYDDIGVGPSYETVENYAKEPSKRFQDLRMYQGGDWREKYSQNELVKLMYDVIHYAT